MITFETLCKEAATDHLGGSEDMWTCLATGVKETPVHFISEATWNVLDQGLKLQLENKFGHRAPRRFLRSFVDKIAELYKRYGQIEVNKEQVLYDICASLDESAIQDRVVYGPSLDTLSDQEVRELIDQEGLYND